MDYDRIEVPIMQLDKVNKQIDDIEKQYPFIVSTIIAAISIIVTVATNELKNNIDGGILLEVSIIALPVIAVLVMCHILNLFRQVALLRGYASYIEECINKEEDRTIVIWNSKYIDGFVENNKPNILIMISSIIATIIVLIFYVKNILFKSNLDLVYKYIIAIVFALFVIIISYNFSQNDRYRRLSYWKAKEVNEKIIRVLIYSEFKCIIRKSGVGKAECLQKKSLDYSDVYYTSDIKCFFNIIHINTFGVKSFLLAKKCRKRNIRVIISAHTILEDFKNSFKFTYNPVVHRLFKAWIIRYYNLASIIIAPSEYVKDLLQSNSYNITTQIEVVSNGVDLNLFSSNRKNRDNAIAVRNIINKANVKFKDRISENDKMVISVGLYIERKGIIDFIRIAQLMPDYKFVWFGHTPNLWIPNKISREIKKSRKVKNIYFPGYMDHNILAKAYNMADIFLFLSKEETEGIVMLEALASKIPIIVNDLMVYRKWLKDGIDCYKVQAINGIIQDNIIINLIQQIISSEANSTVENGYEIAKERDLHKVGLLLKEIYMKALTEKYLGNNLSMK